MEKPFDELTFVYGCMCFGPKTMANNCVCDGQNKNSSFWKRPDCLEVIVSSFADRHRVVDQQVLKKHEHVVFPLVYECVALFPRYLPRKNAHALIH